jgi:hypothetical protein
VVRIFISENWRKKLARKHSKNRKAKGDGVPGKVLPENLQSVSFFPERI